MKKTIALCLILALCLSLLTACGQSTPESTESAQPAADAEATTEAAETAPVQEAAELHSICTTAMETFDPLSYAEADRQVLHALFDCLFLYDSDGNPQPMLADSWTQDGLTVTIRLREDAVFSDGNPVTASDVVFSYEKMLEDSSLQTSLTMWSAGMRAVDTHTVELTLASESCRWQSFLAETLYIVEAAAYDDSADYSQTPPTGSGAYLLEGVTGSGTVVLRARSDYWRGTPAFDSVRVYIAVDDFTALRYLKSGDLDIALGIGRDTSQEAETYEGVSTQSFDSWSTMGIMAFTGDAAFRQAVSCAVDRDAIAAACSGTAATELFSDKLMDDLSGIVTFDTASSQDAAQTCLSASTADLDHVYTITVFDEEAEAAAACVQEALSAIGIETQISKVDIATWFEALMAGSLELTVTAMGSDMASVEDLMSMFLVETGGYPFPVSDELAALLQTAPFESDAQAHEQAMTTLLEQLADECLWIPLYHVRTYLAYNDRVGNLPASAASTGIVYFSELTLA